MKKTFEQKTFEEMNNLDLAILAEMEMESANLFEGKRASRELEKMEFANEKAKMLKKFSMAIAAATSCDDIDNIWYGQICGQFAQKLSESDFFTLQEACWARKF